MKKVFIRGNKERGSEVIKMLEDLGGVNRSCLKGTSEILLYYINKDNRIDGASLKSNIGILIPECFEELHLPEPNKELPNTWEEWIKQTPLNKTEYFIDESSIISENPNPLVLHLTTQRDIYGCDNNCLATQKDAEAILALIKLKRLRDTYRQGWTPNWKNNSEMKYSIEYYEGMLYRCGYLGVTRFLSFQSEEIRDKFYVNFKNLIEQAKEFI